MNLLLRFAQFLITVVFRLSVSLLAILFRLLLPVFLSLLSILRGLVFSSLTATVNGPGQYIDRLASEWTRQLLERGIPRDNIDQLYNLCHFLVAARIVLGWVIAALVTAGILRIVFELFI